MPRPTMPDIRLITLDLDDTLLNSDKHISPRTEAALRRAAEAGVEIVPASGRGAQTLWKYVEQLGTVDAVVTTNGSQVLNRQHEVIFERRIPKDTARQIARFAEDHNWYIQGYTADDFYYEKVTKETELYHQFGGHWGYPIGKLSENITEDPYKMIFIEEDMEEMARLRAAADERFSKEVNLFGSKPFYYEATAPGCTKGEALLRLAEEHGISREEIMCCGDSDNDLSMLDAAGYAVAVGNARDSVKAHANIVCASNDEEGVAQVVEQYIL